MALRDVSLKATSGYVPSLDGMRAFSIALVLFGHLLAPPMLAGIGGFGVTIFFFISGFLITRLLFVEINDTHRIAIGKFWLRRVLRLYPAVVVSITFMALLAVYRGEKLDTIELASVFFYFTNYLTASRELSNTPFMFPIGALWSLAVEEHFYLIFPLAFFLPER